MGSKFHLRLFIFSGLITGSIYLLYSQGAINSINTQFFRTGNQKSSLAISDYKFQAATKREMIQTVLATGTVTLEVGAEVKIGSRISGQLEELFVKIGDFVKAGQIIAVIEHSNLIARVAKRKAELQAEKARFSKFSNEGPLEVNKARAGLEELQVKMKLSKKMVQRNRRLNKQGVVSETILDQSKEDIEVLTARIKSANESLKLKESQLVHDIRLAEANVAKARANLMEEETQLSYATITAPTDGIVASISTQKGETVAASFNSPTFVNLINLRKLEVTVFVDETDIGKVKVDQHAKFTVDSFPKIFFKGKVRDIHPKAIIKDNVVNYEAILKISKKGLNLLRPEMTANVIITTDRKENVLTVHKKAVKRKNKKVLVTVKAENQLLEKTIETGWRDGEYIEVLSGLEEGDYAGIPIKHLKE